jgi:dipeptidyl aminopeptidase/acylaminoacyl peptidase
MHDDLLDAVEWAVREGIARRDRIAIMGGSYGGYASFVGATFTPKSSAALCRSWE